MSTSWPLRALLAAWCVACVAPVGVAQDPTPATRPSSQVAKWVQKVQQTEQEAKEQLARFAGTYSTGDEWRQRASTIREGILRGAQLLPPPARCPLKPIIHSKRQYKGYSVENVAIESLPGLFVAGNLYRPTEGKGPFPVVLCPHGHFRGSEKEGPGRLRPDHQKRCATLARMGAVAFSWDLPGWAEGEWHFKHNELPDLMVAINLWNGTRVIDFITTLPDVDAKRVAITGCSGGGTQSFLLTAIDDRITASAPVCMVSAHFFGGCKCESGMPIHRSERHETNNAEVAALAAPRPQLIISITGDWTKNVPEVEFPYIRSVYKLLGAEGNVENVHLAGAHDYGLEKRQPMYRFLARHLGLSLKAVTAADGSVDETDSVVEHQDHLKAFDDKHPRPAYALKGAKAVTEAFHAATAKQ